MTLILGLFALAFALAGFAGAPSNDGVTAVAVPSQEPLVALASPTPRDTWHSVRLEGQLHAVDGVAAAGPMDQHVLDVQVAPGATGVLLELRWVSDDAGLGVAVDDRAHGATMRFSGAADAVDLRIDLTRTPILDAGTYRVHVVGEQAVGEPFELAVTVFYADAMPAGFSALGNDAPSGDAPPLGLP